VDRRRSHAIQFQYRIIETIRGTVLNWNQTRDEALAKRQAGSAPPSPPVSDLSGREMPGPCARAFFTPDGNPTPNKNEPEALVALQALQQQNLPAMNEQLPKPARAFLARTGFVVLSFSMMQKHEV